MVIHGRNSLCPPRHLLFFWSLLETESCPPNRKGGGPDTVQAKAKTILSVLPQETHGKLIKHFGFMSLG